jgi:hypothetical protein
MNGRSVAKAVVLIVFFAALSGCATTVSTTRQAPAVDVSGVWSGTWHGGGGGGDMSFSLKQTGAEVSGAVVIPGWAQNSGPLVGTVAGNVFSYRTTATTPGGGELTVTGDQMSGVGVHGNRLVMRRQR